VGPAEGHRWDRIALGVTYPRVQLIGAGARVGEFLCCENRAFCRAESILRSFLQGRFAYLVCVITDARFHSLLLEMFKVGPSA